MDTETADPANDDLDLAQQAIGEPAEVDDAQQTTGDPAEPRSDAEGDTPEPADDASQDTTDPLILAQLEAPQADEQTTPKPTPVAKPQPKPATKPDQAQAKPAEKPKQEPAEPAEEDPTADLPPEDWQKLSHKAKSQYLSQRKTIVRSKQEREAAAKERDEVRKQLDAVDRFVKDSGLSNEDYVNGVNVVAAVTRRDARALPVLEKTLADLRQHLGVAAPETQSSTVDAAELVSLIEEAETSLDFDKLRALSAKLKASKQAPAPQAKPAAAAPEQQPQQRGAPAPASHAEATVNASVYDYLVVEGVDSGRVLPYLQGLISDITEGGKKPLPQVQDRLRAVMGAHRARQAKATKAPAKASSPPLSGGGRPVVSGRPPATNNADPLKHAMPGRR